MDLNKSLLYSLLSNLKEIISKIERMDLTMEMIEGDEDIQDMIDRRMQKAIEICIDIAAHLAASLNLPRKEKASDVFLLLSDNKIINPNLAKKIAQAVGLRNIIIHEYAKIDLEIL